MPIPDGMCEVEGEPVVPGLVDHDGVRHDRVRRHVAPLLELQPGHGHPDLVVLPVVQAEGGGGLLEHPELGLHHVEPVAQGGLGEAEVEEERLLVGVLGQLLHQVDAHVALW